MGDERRASGLRREYSAFLRRRTTGSQTLAIAAFQQLDDIIRLYEPYNVLLYLLCEVGIKPGDRVVSYFRK